MEMFGQHFVTYVARRLDDHEALLSVLGRHLRDFLNGLDNLHDARFFFLFFFFFFLFFFYLLLLDS